MTHMTKSIALMMSALGIAGLLLLGGCHYDSVGYGHDYHYDGGHGDYNTGYVIKETRHRAPARRHYSTGYNVGYHTGYHGGGSYISVGHSTTHYRHTGYSHCGSRYGHRSHYGHRGHGGYIHFGTSHGGYHCR